MSYIDTLALRDMIFTKEIKIYENELICTLCISIFTVYSTLLKMKYYRKIVDSTVLLRATFILSIIIYSSVFLLFAMTYIMLYIYVLYMYYVRVYSYLSFINFYIYLYLISFSMFVNQKL